MAMATAGDLPALSPANSGGDLRRRRVHDGDQDDATETTAWTTKLGVDGVDDEDRSELYRAAVTFEPRP
jgi:hypothetical protein